MAITQISNNVILDGTILPAKLNISSALKTFLGSATSANLAGAVSGTTGSGNLVFATSPTLTTPTFTGDVTSNVGAGRMLVNKTSSSGVREELFRATVSDATNDFFFIANGTISDSQFRPVFAGMQNTVSTGWSLGFSGYVTSGNDASDSSNFGVIDFAAMRSSSTTDPINGSLGDLVNRKAFTFRSANTNYMTIMGNGSVSIASSSISAVTVPNTKAILDLNSTTKGFLPPRMTETERNAITSVPAALLVYNTTANSISLYNGTAWGEVLTTHAASFTSDTLRNAVSDETGTGSLVFATAPTITNGNFTYDDAAAAAHRTSLSLDRHYIQQGVNQQSSIIVYDFDNSYMPAMLGLSRAIPSGGSVQIANVGGTHWTSKVKGWLRVANPTANDAVTEVSFSDATMPYQSGTGAPTAHNNYTLVYVFCCPNLTNVDIRLGLRTGNVARIIQLFQDNVASPGSSPVFNFFTSNGTYTNTATATGAISGAPTPQVGSYITGTGTRYAFVFDTYQRAGGTDTSVTLKIYSGNVTGDLSLAGTYVLASWNPTNTGSTPYVSVRTINSTAAASSFLHLDTVIFKSWNNTSNILPAEILDIIKTP